MSIHLEILLQAILRQYKGQLYNYALTKLVYLVDLESVRRTGKQLTDIKWVRNSYGPFVWDVLECANQHHEIFKVFVEDKDKKKVVLNAHGDNDLAPDEVLTIVRTVALSAPDPNLCPEDFLNYVYATPPMVVSQGFGPLDTVESVLAADEMNEFFDSMADNEEFHEAMSYLAAN